MVINDLIKDIKKEWKYNRLLDKNNSDDLIRQIKSSLKGNITKENRNNPITGTNMYDFYSAPGDLCTLIMPVSFDEYYTYIDNLPKIVIEEKKSRINNLKLLHYSHLDDEVEVYKGIASMLDNFKEQLRTDFKVDSKEDDKSKAIFWSIVGTYLGSKTLKLPQEALDKLTNVGGVSGAVLGTFIFPGVGTVLGGLSGAGAGYLSPFIYGSKQRLKVRSKKKYFKRLNEENRLIKSRVESVSNQIRYQDVNVRQGVLQDFLQDTIEQYLREERAEYRDPLPVTLRLDWVGRSFKAIMDDEQAVSRMSYSLQRYYHSKIQQYGVR